MFGCFLQNLVSNRFTIFEFELETMLCQVFSCLLDFGGIAQRIISFHGAIIVLHDECVFLVCRFRLRSRAKFGNFLHILSDAISDAEVFRCFENAVFDNLSYGGIRVFRSFFFELNSA